MNLGLRTDGQKHVLEIPKAWTEIAVRVSERVGGGGEVTSWAAAFSHTDHMLLRVLVPVRVCTRVLVHDHISTSTANVKHTSSISQLFGTSVYPWFDFRQPGISSFRAFHISERIPRNTYRSTT